MFCNALPARNEQFQRKIERPNSLAQVFPGIHSISGKTQLLYTTFSKMSRNNGNLPKHKLFLSNQSSVIVLHLVEHNPERSTNILAQLDTRSHLVDGEKDRYGYCDSISLHHAV